MDKKILLLLICSVSLHLVAVEGLLDPSFNPAGNPPGTVTTQIASQVIYLANAMQADGKIIAAGLVIVSSVSQIVVARYTKAGVLDTTFGSGLGYVITLPAGATLARANGVAVQSDGKIVIAGRTTIDGIDRIIVARYTTDGVLDATFGSGLGYVLTTITGATFSAANGVVLQADGKIVIGGQANPGQTRIVVARYTTDGVLDTTFNAAGTQPGTTQTVITGQSSSQANAVALQSNGKIVIAGQATVGSIRIVVARYTTDGVLDTTFNDAGTQPGTVQTLIGASSLAASVAIQSDDKIVVAGSSPTAGATQIAIARYTAEGVLDPSFSPTGTPPGTVVTVIAGSTSSLARGVAIQLDGKIVAAGETTILGVLQVALARYTTDGALDAAFGSGVGYVLTPVGSAARARAVTLQLDGKIVIAGDATVSGVGMGLVARYFGTPTTASCFAQNLIAKYILRLL